MSMLNRKSLVMLIAFSCLFALPAAPQDPIAPHSAYEPPAAKDAAALTASTKASPPDLLTTSEKTDWAETGKYAEVVELSHRLERSSKFVKVLEFGTTPEGRTMVAMVVSKDRAFTPAAAAKTNKAVILIQSGIHSGEIEGKDTAIMLVRDMVVSKRYASWLDQAIFVVIPVFNVDGHEDFSPFHRASQNGPKSTGLRETKQDLNLNRDYIKADTPEMRAWLRLHNAWMPDFMFDNHVTDGSDMQYDVTWDMARNQDIAEPVRTWVNQTYVPELNRLMEADGHGVAPYGGLRNMPDGKREFFMEVFSPRYSHLYSAVRNRPCLLVETHSLKTTRTRAWADYDIMRHTIDIISKDPQTLRKAVREADRTFAAQAGDRSAPAVYLGGKVSETQSEPLVYRALKLGPYKSAVTGATVNGYLPEADDISTVIHDKIDTTAEAQMPLGYLIPVAWKSLADELALQGVEIERVAQPLEQEFETYRFSNVKFAPNQFEGRVMVDFDAKPVKEKVTIPAGSFWVPMKQQRARLILAMLEPQAPDSLARWGFCNQVFVGGGRGAEGAYLTEPIARRMMADSPELRKQFEDRVASDPAFAADPQARLMWWYERSNYSAGGAGRYPVVRVWDKTW
jgi:Zinc carboxypeptidase